MHPFGHSRFGGKTLLLIFGRFMGDGQGLSLGRVGGFMGGKCIVAQHHAKRDFIAARVRGAHQGHGLAACPFDQRGAGLAGLGRGHLSRHDHHVDGRCLKTAGPGQRKHLAGFRLFKVIAFGQPQQRAFCHPVHGLAAAVQGALRGDQHRNPAFCFRKCNGLKGNKTDGF